MRNIFLKKSNTKYGGEDSPRPFYKKSKIEHISGSTAWNVVQFVFIVCPSGCVPKYTKTKAVITCFDFIKSFFQKTKRVLDLVFLSYFLYGFWRNIFLTTCSINWPNFITWLPLILEILGNMCIAIICL